MNTGSLDKAIAEVGRRRKKTKWKGYTLDELRAHRVVVQARILIEKNRLDLAMKSVQARRAQDKSVVQRILSALNIVDYSIMAVAVVRRVSSIVSHLRGRGKN